MQEYQVYDAKKWGHLYWIPILPMDELGSYVECSGCSGQYKAEVLEYAFTKKEGTFSKQSEVQKFASASDAVARQVSVATMLYGDQIEGMDTDQKARFLAFEFGVIDYFGHQLLSRDDTEFLNFLIFHSRRSYPEHSELIFQYWHSLATSEAKLTKQYDQVKLGFESVANQTLPDGSMKQGHYPGRYLKEAVGF
jgi:hypothetical protein